MGIWEKIFRKKKTISQIADYNFELSDTKGKAIEDFINLNADNRMRQIMLLGDSANPRYFKLLKFAILSDPDTHVRFAGLKRIHLFKDHPEVKPMLNKMLDEKAGEDLEPYFSMALSRLGIISIEEFKSKINSKQ